MDGNADFTIYLTFRCFEYYDWAVFNKDNIQFVSPLFFLGTKELSKELQQAGNLMPSFASFELADLAIFAGIEPPQKRICCAMR